MCPQPAGRRGHGPRLGEWMTSLSRCLLCRILRGGRTNGRPPPSMPVALVARLPICRKAPSHGPKIHIPQLTLVIHCPWAILGRGCRGRGPPGRRGNPVIVPPRRRAPQAFIARLIELAEALQAPVIDQEKQEFPPIVSLDHSEPRPRSFLSRVILGLELYGFFGGVTHTFARSFAPHHRTGTKDGRKRSDHSLRSVCQRQLPGPARFRNRSGPSPDAGDHLPSRTEGRQEVIPDDLQEDLLRIEAATGKTPGKSRWTRTTEATYGWDSSPAPIARLSAELVGANQKLRLGRSSRTWDLQSRWPSGCVSFANTIIHRRSGPERAKATARRPPQVRVSNHKHGRVSVPSNVTET